MLCPCALQRKLRARTAVVIGIRGALAEVLTSSRVTTAEILSDFRAILPHVDLYEEAL